MALVASHWKFDLGSLVPRRTRRNISLAPVNREFFVDLDVSDFGSPLPVQEILLEPSKQPESAEIIPSEWTPWPRVVLIPTPPPRPTREMLIAAVRALHPHQFPNSPPQALSSRSASLSSRIYHMSETVSISPEESSTIATTSDPIPSTSGQQCMVCMENRDTAEFPDGPITSHCYHPSLTCRRCLEYSIASDHTSKMWNNIQCPQCYQRLSYEEVRNFADPDTFAHYDLLTTRQTLSALPNFIWCSSCPAGQLHETDSPSTCPAVTCNNCSSITCFTHRAPWHTGLSCQQYDRLLKRSTLTVLASLFPSSLSPTHILSKSSPSLPSLSLSSNENLPTTTTTITSTGASPVEVKDDVVQKVKVFRREQQASLRDIRRACKMCPGTGCGAMIYKIDGCKHMTCLKCSHEFCWGCGKNWFYGHKCWKLWRNE